MRTVTYQRYEHGESNTVGGWTLVKKEFNTKDEANLFILRISKNLIVGKIWMK